MAWRKKILLRRLASQQILLFLYILCTIALTEAMGRWQAAQVSAIITLTPLFTLIFSNFLALFQPAAFAPPPLNFVGYSGAVVVVAGAMCFAVGHRWWPEPNRRATATVIKPSGK